MKLLSAIILGVFAYIGLHYSVLRQPLTIGYIKGAYDFKTQYAKSLGEARKIVILGGSSSLFGVRCQVIAEETHLPCVNMAVTAGIGIDLMLTKTEGVIHPGDIVILPLEYDFYSTKAEDLLANATANTYLATYDHSLLAQQEWRRIGTALLSLSIEDVYSSLVEMSLQTIGVQRRFRISQLTAQGDMTGNTLELAADYSSYIASVPGIVPKVEDGAGLTLINSFIARQLQRQVHIYGTDPTTVDDGTNLAPGFLAVEQVWLQSGAKFLALPNRGRYPQNWFYDTAYHLNETGQINHSKALAEHLKTAEGINNGPP